MQPDHEGEDQVSRSPSPVNTLPASLVDVAETLGLAVALKLIQHFGGQDVKWPVDPRPDHAAIKILGEKDGRAVCEYLSGAQIYIPHARPARSAKADVARLEAHGHDRAAIARMLGISMRHVRRMANRPEDDDRQSTLNFD